MMNNANATDTQGGKSKNNKNTKSKQVIPKQYKAIFTKWTGH